MVIKFYDWKICKQFMEVSYHFFYHFFSQLMGFISIWCSLDNIEECMQKTQYVKYGEEVCFNGMLMLKASSSGLELGNCVWTIKGPRASMTYLPSSIFVSAHALDYD